jgi:hypothetical protein
MRTYLTTARDKITQLLVRLLSWVCGKAIEYDARRFSKMSTLCRVSCFVEMWSQITDGKPVDRTSPLFDELNDVINYYLSETSNSRESIGYFERQMLPYNWARWNVRDQEKGNEDKYRTFVNEHRLFTIIKHHANIENYIKSACNRAADAVRDQG